MINRRRKLPVQRQGELPDLHRTGAYYMPPPVPEALSRD